MSDEKQTEAQYSKPSSQLDLEYRKSRGNKSDRVISTAEAAEQPSAPDDAPGYIGVDPQYQNHANHTEAPGVDPDSVEDQVAASFLGVEKLDAVEPTQDGEDATVEVDGSDAKHEDESSASVTPPAKKTTSSKSSNS